MNFILNIGLQEGTDGPLLNPQLTAGAARAHINACGMRITKYADRVVPSATEPTLIIGVSVEGNSWRIMQAVDEMAKEFKQEAIAVFNPDNGHGALAGPQAKKWGPFNPEHFIMLDGKTLAKVAA